MTLSRVIVQALACTGMGALMGVILSSFFAESLAVVFIGLSLGGACGSMIGWHRLRAHWPRLPESPAHSRGGAES